ncbi:hypothetical protein BH09VER1_BH09VER1_11910 [soil metagenome]
MAATNQWATVLGAGAILAVAGCETFQSAAPAVTPEMVAMAAADGNTAKSLASGRRLLAMRCTSCHSLVPISKYRAVEWPARVDQMADRARLNASDQAQITAYLVAVRRSLSPTQTGSGDAGR